MANAKISDGAFIVTTDITTIDGLAGYSGAVNSKISGSALVSSLETNLNLDNFTLGKLPITRGGTGNSTAQTAINTLSSVSGATEGQVLTKVGTNAEFQTPQAPIYLVGTFTNIINSNGRTFVMFGGGEISAQSDQGSVFIFPEKMKITNVTFKWLSDDAWLTFPNPSNFTISVWELDDKDGITDDLSNYSVVTDGQIVEWDFVTQPTGTGNAPWETWDLSGDPISLAAGEFHAIAAEYTNLTNSSEEALMMIKVERDFS